VTSDGPHVREVNTCPVARDTAAAAEHIRDSIPLVVHGDEQDLGENRSKNFVCVSLIYHHFRLQVSTIHPSVAQLSNTAAIRTGATVTVRDDPGWAFSWVRMEPLPTSRRT